MNYILIMVEGSDELEFINILIERQLLLFSREELLMEKPFQSRQITGELVGFIQMLPIEDTVTIYRVGDKLSDKLKIPKSILPTKIKEKFDICTTPEFEILFLLHENLYDEYIKNKSKEKPSTFYKKKNKCYNKQASYIRKYFTSMSNQAILELIQLYCKKRGKNLKCGQFSLEKIVNMVASN